MTPHLAIAEAPVLNEEPLAVRTERPDDAAGVLALVDAAFGPGRYAKASERVREGNRHRSDLSFCALEGPRLIGSVRLWPCEVGEASGLFLGPIAVDPAARRRGVARRLISAALAAADAAQSPFVLLVGDPPIFGPHGFRAARAVSLPGPADPARVLIRTLIGLDEPAGPVSPPRGRP